MPETDLGAPPRAATRPLGRVAGLGVALYAFSLGWLVIGLWHEWAYPVFGWIPAPALAALSAYACYVAGRREELAVTSRRFWRRIACAALLLTAATVSSAFDALTGPGAPSQYVAPHTLGLYLLSLTTGLWALLRLPTWHRTRGDWARFGLDATIVLITCGGLAWHFSFRQIEGWTKQTGSVVPLLIIVLMAVFAGITVAKISFAGVGELDRRALHLLGGGIGVSALTGSLTPLLAGHPYLSSVFIAITSTSLGTTLAAARQARAPIGAAAARPRRQRFTLIAPYLAIAAMSATLIAVVRPHGGEDLLIALCAVALTGLVALRQVAALRDNTRLLDTVDANLRQLRSYQAQLDHQVSHDALTEIPNRANFGEKVAARLAAGETFHVALLDVDDFKAINDRYGHGLGDALLRAVSRRLTETMSCGEGVVARLGGDEFTLLLPGDAGAASMLLGDVVEAVRAPLPLGDLELAVRISVGVTGSEPGDTPEELLRRADVAMYAAKSRGGGRWTWFDPIMDAAADTDAKLGADLRRALERDELFLVYQPIVELPDGKLAGVEALVRWRHPAHGLVSPGVFIPLAERNGTIIELGRWVLRSVMKQASDWEREFGDDAPRKVSVNISARQLQEPGFPAEVGALLLESGVNPGRIVAEVTETAVLGTGRALDAIRALHEEYGLRVALDDFGTGQSSLSLLVDTPVGVLKVDKSFVDGLTTAGAQAVIVDGLIGITTGLRIEAVAEGVETAEQAEHLYRIGYQLAQGFHFARPMPPEDVALLIEKAAVSRENTYVR